MLTSVQVAGVCRLGECYIININSLCTDFVEDLGPEDYVFPLGFLELLRSMLPAFDQKVSKLVKKISPLRNNVAGMVQSSNG